MLKDDYNASPEAVLTVAAFCRTCAIGKSSFYMLVAAGRIRIKKFGRRTLVPSDQVAVFLESLG